jgi:hypothetical protein
MEIQIFVLLVLFVASRALFLLCCLCVRLLNFRVIEPQRRADKQRPYIKARRFSNSACTCGSMRSYLP